MNAKAPILKKYAVGDVFKSAHGYTATVLRRKGDWLLLEKRKAAVSTPGYEAVFVRRLKHPREFPTATYAVGSEYLPRDEDWGTLGFTFPTLEYAQERFAQLSGTTPEFGDTDSADALIES